MNPTLIGSGVWWDQGTGQILIPGFSAAVCVWQKGIGSSI
jgi:hypothetical protein